MSECLQDLCRLCGGSGAAGVARRKPHSKEKYLSILLRALNVDISHDVESTHPPFICHSCFKKLDRWWKATKTNQKATCRIEVISFNPHVCSDICNLRKASSTEPDVSIFDSFITTANLQGCLTWRGEDRLKIMQFGVSGCSEIELNIFNDNSWRLDVCGVDVVESGCLLFSDVPPSLGSTEVEFILNVFKMNNVCLGNPDYPAVVKAKEGPAGQIPISITNNDVYQTHPHRTIRHKRCRLLVLKPKLRCDVCQMLRVELSVIASRRSTNVNMISTSSSVRNDALSHTQLQEKVKLMKGENKTLKRRSVALQEKVSSMMEQDSVSVTQKHNSFLHQAMEEGESAFRSAVPQNSYSALLWEQQKASFSKGKGMRWHPAIVRFCIALHNKSSSSYNFLRESGFLKLPHPNTLHPYTHFGNPSSGFNFDLVLRVVEDLNLHSLPEHERNVSVMFDEMKVKAGLVFSVRSGAIVGFVDVGSIGNEILQFETRCKGADIPVASHVLVLMIRGIFTSVRSPVGFYPSLGVSSHQLYPCIWEAIILLESVGFIVRALISDGASANRKLYRLHGPAKSLTYSVSHPAAPRKVFFFCDAPHLMKTTRNNWENSGCHNKTRNLHFRKQDIKWSHLLQLYDWDIGLNRSSPGLRRLHKITYEHLHLTPTLRMRVYMATQVLSSTVGNALEAFGRHDTASTQLFVNMFDKFFDCLNVSNPHKSAHKLKPALAPYKSIDDWRFKWLQEDFLGFLAKWETEVKNAVNVPTDVRQKMCLSRETVEGLRITVKSFTELAQTLLEIPEVEYLLSERFNQDPLEMYFSKQRSAGGTCDNPTAEQFGHNMMSFHVARSCIKASKRGNCQKSKEDVTMPIIDATPLPKRPKAK